MFKNIIPHAAFNERTGYGIHSSRFFAALDKLHQKNKKDTDAGDVHISLLDVVTASQIQTFPPSPSILYSVWESTQYPQEFINKLKHYDQLWVPSEWQRAASIAQGIPEEFVKVVPEGVDADIYKPGKGPYRGRDASSNRPFTFLHIGQWQPRKSTLEIIQAFLKAFPIEMNIGARYGGIPEVRLELSADTLFPSDEYKSTEERLKAYGINDPRIIPVHYEEREEYVRRLQGSDCFVSCARSEGWGLPIIEAMACFPARTDVIANDIRKTMVKLFSGELVVIELDNTIIEATPDHPFWTKNGWKLAKELDNTDQLLYCPNYGGQKNAAIYAGRIADIESAISINYDNGIIEDNGEKLFVGIMAKASDGSDEATKEYSKVSSFGYKSNGRELSGRDHRWRGDCYVKENASEEMEAVDPNSQHFSDPSELVDGESEGSIHSHIKGNKQEGKQGTVVPVCDTGDMSSSALQNDGTVIGDQEKTHANSDRVLRGEVGATISHSEYGAVNESYIRDPLSEYKAIRKVSTQTVENLPVYNFQTQSGLYTANGFLVHNCGIPTIVSDWGGSTEYHKGAITVPVKQLIKPFGIYGNWDVPGKWCEPDFDKLVEAMRDAYRDISHKERALKLSEKIRTEFSWDAAAQKGFDVLQELYDSLTVEQKFGKPVEVEKFSVTEADIRKYAAAHGFKISGVEKEKSIFVVGTWPNSSEKMESLLETITQIRQLGFPVLISTHYPLPSHIIEMADYVLYEKKNVLSDDWRATYGRTRANGQREEKESRIPYHGVACLNAIRNAVDFCFNKYDRMFYIEYDSEVDVDIFVDKVRESSAPFVGVKYEGQGIHTDLWSGELSWLFNNIPVINSWEEYKAGIDERIFKNEYPLEIWLWNRLKNVQRQVAFVDIPITNRFDQVDRELWDDDIFRVHFFDGPYLFIDGLSRREYDVQYKVGDTVIYNVKQKVGMWSKPKIKYYLPWEVTASIDGVEKFRHTIDLKGKRVLIQMASKALGDSIAWIPYVEEFRKKYDCHVLCSGWWQEIFDYPEIEWVKPGSEVKDIYASYQIGCFDDQPDMNPKNWRETPLQKVAADILGLKYEPLRAKLKKFPSTQNGDGRDYICFSEFSTMKNKMWNRPGAWQKVVDKCRSLGYKCISVSAEPTQLNDVIKHNGQPIEKTIEDIRKCTFYIGLNHGPSWIAYALGVPVLMITGVSEEWNDFPNPYRIAINNKVCGVGCFNDPALPIDRGWEWCPRGKDYACTKEITEQMVYEKIHELSVIRRDAHVTFKKGKKSKGQKREHIGADAHREVSAEASCSNSDGNRSALE